MTEQPPVARFIAGTLTALARADVWLLVDRPLTDPFALHIWSLMSAGESVDEILDGLLAPGLRAAPAFALAENRGQDVRVLARGDFSVRGENADGPFEVPGQNICADVSVAEVEHLELCASEPTGDPVAPLVMGIVPADGVTIRFREPNDQGTAAAGADADRASITESQPEAAEPLADDEALAAVRGYERLFGDPAGVDEPSSATPAPPPPVELAPQAAVAAETATLIEAAAPGAEVAPAPKAETSASNSGIIEALPDFFGPLAGRMPERPAVDAGAPLPATPPAPAGRHPGPVPNDVGTPVTPRTVNRAQLNASLELAGPTVWAAWCPLGHPSQAFGATCRVCGRAIAQQEPQEIPRPLLGQLVVPGAPAIQLDSNLVLGRDPHVPPGADRPVPRLVVLQDPRHEVSGQHASITLNFWDVGLTDLGSTNGTEIITPDGRRQRLSPNVPVTIVPKTRIILGEVLEMVFEASA